MSEPKLLSQKMAELDDQINWFYSDDFSLDESAKNTKRQSPPPKASVAILTN